MTLPRLPQIPRHKLAGGLAVAVLHMLIVAIFIQATNIRAELARPAHEIQLWFVPPKPKAKTTPQPPAAAVRKRHVIAPTQIYPDYNNVTLPPVNRGTALKGLPSFFDCSAQNQHRLTPDEEAQCASAATLGPRHDNSAVDYADHTNRSHDAALWARGRARKNAPALLPCMNPQGFDPLGTLLCLGKAAVDSKFDLDNQPGYADRPQDIPNNGDPPHG